VGIRTEIKKELARKNERIARLYSVISERNAEVERLTAENATLQTLVPHTGDGTCYVCGSSPAHDVPMCEGCCDAFAKIEEFAVEAVRP
jgi:hypothetical protein